MYPDEINANISENSFTLYSNDIWYINDDSTIKVKNALHTKDIVSV
jgi:hypothetical protein